MTAQNPAQASTLAGGRVQPDGPLSGAVKRGGRTAKKLREVYFVQAGEGGLIKIGVADDAASRLAQLATMSPTPLRLLGIIRCRKYGELERSFHYIFSGHRRHGEWFEPVEALLRIIDIRGWKDPARVVTLQMILERTEDGRGKGRAVPKPAEVKARARAARIAAIMRVQARDDQQRKDGSSVWFHVINGKSYAKIEPYVRVPGTVTVYEPGWTDIEITAAMKRAKREHKLWNAPNEWDEVLRRPGDPQGSA